MTNFVFFPLLLCVIGVVIILPIVLICVLLGRRRNPSSAPVVSPAPGINPEARNQRREAILGRLAAKEITREEAERQLVELDNPVPEQMPAPPPANKGCSSGCLVAVICGIVVFVLLILLLLGSFFGLKTTAVNQHHSIQMEMNQ